MPGREDSRSARIRLFTTGVVVVIALGAGADTATAAGSGDALKQARTKYNAAQNKCVKHHQLKQLPRILKFANKIKKLGGGKIKKKQLYKCLKFELRFDDHLTLKGNEHADNRSITHNWSYFVTDLGPGELKPDYKDAASDLVVSSGELLDTHSFSGSATFHRDGNPTSAVEQAAGTVGSNANSYGASVLINPSAKDPRKTIELSISANPPVERYSLKHANGDTETQKGQVWLVAYNWVHRKQKDPAPFTRCGTTNFQHLAAGLPDGTATVASPTYTASTAMPLAAADNACQFPNGYRTFPISASESPWDIKSMNVTDSASLELDHTP